MAKYLDPKADLTFKKVFGEHPNLVASLLNSLLPLPAGEEIAEKFWGRTPKTLGFSRFLGFGRASRQLRRSSEGAGVSERAHPGPKRYLSY